VDAAAAAGAGAAAAGDHPVCCGLAVAAAVEAGGAVPEAALPGGAVVLACGAGSGPGAATRFEAALAVVLAARDAGTLPVVVAEEEEVEDDAGESCPSHLSSLSPADALFGGRAVETVPLSSAGGRVAAAALTPYPPGIPAVLPGEALGEGVVRRLEATLARGGRVTGAAADGGVRVFR
jgi:hypothetical protein